MPVATPPSAEERQYLADKFDRQTESARHHHDLDVIDIAPKSLKTQTVTFLAPGWGATTAVYRETIIALASTGRRVVAVASLPELSENSPAYKFSGRNLPAIEWQKAEQAVAILQQKNLTRVDAVGHSESALFLSLAAIKHPKRFRNLVLVNPVALARKRSPWRLLWRSLKEYWAVHKSPATPEHVRSSFFTHAKVMLANPKLHWSPMETFLRSTLPPILRRLKQRGHGISIIHGVDDKFFPIEEIEDSISHDIVDTFYPVSGTHSEFHLDPDPITTVVAFSLDELEKKHHL